MKENFFWISSLLGILVLYGCPSNKLCREHKGIDYDFQLPAEILNKQDTFTVGSVIELSSTFSDKVLDANSGQEIELVEYNFFPGIRLIKIDTFPHIEGFLHCTEIEVYTERHQLIPHSSGTSSLLFDYDYKDGNYSFSMIMKMQKKGVYYLTMASGIELERPDIQDFPGKCSGRTAAASVIMNGGQDNNFELLQLSEDERTNSTTEEEFNKWGGFCFVVE